MPFMPGGSPSVRIFTSWPFSTTRPLTGTIFSDGQPATNPSNNTQRTRAVGFMIHLVSRFRRRSECARRIVEGIRKGPTTGKGRVRGPVDALTRPEVDCSTVSEVVPQHVAILPV